MIGFECDKARFVNTFDDDVVLTERDFFPPQDDRVYVSMVYDINGGDGFAEYAEWFWEEYGHELYDDFEI